MMADLVDRAHAPRSPVERSSPDAQKVEDRPAIKPDHIGKFARLRHRAALHEAPPAKQAQEIEFASQSIWSSVSSSAKSSTRMTRPCAEVAKSLRQPGIGRRGEVFEIAQRRGGGLRPFCRCHRLPSCRSINHAAAIHARDQKNQCVNKFTPSRSAATTRARGRSACPRFRRHPSNDRPSPLLPRAISPLPHVDETAGDRRCRGHGRRDQMAAPLDSPAGPRNCGWRSRRSARRARACPDSWQGTSNSRARAIRSPAAMKILSSPSASAWALTRPDPGTTMALTCAATFLPAAILAAARRSSMRPLVQEPMKTRSTLRSVIFSPPLSPM